MLVESESSKVRSVSHMMRIDCIDNHSVSSNARIGSAWNSPDSPHHYRIRAHQLLRFKPINTRMRILTHF